MATIFERRKKAFTTEDTELHRGTPQKQTLKPNQFDEIDFLVACIVPEQAWYVLPILAFAPRQYLRLYPHRKLKPKRSRYEQYRDAWRLMSDPDALTNTCSQNTSVTPIPFG